jgi:uncharacterized membrane protein YedE/YeeE
MSLLKAAVPFLVGVLFAAGLGFSGMTNPAKVIAFLDVFGPWDPSLAFVMGGALLVHLPFVQWLRRRGTPALVASGEGDVGIDRALVAGAALFGVGWGLSGLCPGPAFVALASGDVGFLIFVVAMFAGMWLSQATSARLLRGAQLPSSSCS